MPQAYLMGVLILSISVTDFFLLEVEFVQQVFIWLSESLLEQIFIILVGVLVESCVFYPILDYVIRVRLLKLFQIMLVLLMI